MYFEKQVGALHTFCLSKSFFLYIETKDKAQIKVLKN